MDASWGHHDENPVASRDSALDDLAVVGRARDDSDAPLERVELAQALLAAHANHLVTAIQRLLDDVLPELPRSPNDAHSLFVLPSVGARIGLHSGMTRERERWRHRGSAGPTLRTAA